MGCLITEAQQSTFKAISHPQISVKISGLDKKKGKISNFHCENWLAWESIRSYKMVPYKWDIFMFEWGDSPHRPVPYRWGITVFIFSYFCHSRWYQAVLTPIQMTKLLTAFGKWNWRMHITEIEFKGHYVCLGYRQNTHCTRKLAWYCFCMKKGWKYRSEQIYMFYLQWDVKTCCNTGREWVLGPDQGAPQYLTWKSYGR